jgi:nucleoside-diphosphate-sugar epimerase
MGKTNILITGASGRLGRALVSKLLKNGNFNLTGLDISEEESISKSIKFIKSDLDNISLLNKTLDNIDIVCHCAGLHGLDITDININEKYFKSNVLGTQNIYEAANKKKIKKIVLTSSVASNSMNLFNLKWPVNEEIDTLPDDVYGDTKKKQEKIAQSYAEKGLIQTIAIRPGPFFEVNNLEMGFRLTGIHAKVDDIANAHLSAINVLLDNKIASSLKMFEAIFITNKLPYEDEDKKLVHFKGDMKNLITKYWPNDSKLILELGFRKTEFPGIYDLSKALKILKWEPLFNFDEWIIFCKENNLNFDTEKEQYKSKKSLKNRFKKKMLKLKKIFS